MGEAISAEQESMFILILTKLFVESGLVNSELMCSFGIICIRRCGCCQGWPHQPGAVACPSLEHLHVNCSCCCPGALDVFYASDAMYVDISICYVQVRVSILIEHGLCIALWCWSICSWLVVFRSIICMTIIA